VSYDATYLDAAHHHCFGNEPEVRASKIACCISCSKSFDSSLVHESSHQYGDEHRTACCPVCGFDTIIGDNSGYPVVEPLFINAMNAKYFDEPVGSELAWKELKQCSK
jgi:hypothetical protein